MIIAGNLDNYFYECYDKLKEIILDLKLIDCIPFEINVNLDKLLSFMQKDKTYFHPRAGGYFGISVVEAKSANLMPIVTNIGRQQSLYPKIPIQHAKI
jgi:hypothetical protein